MIEFVPDFIHSKVQEEVRGNTEEKSGEECQREKREWTDLDLAILLTTLTGKYSRNIEE